MKISVFGLGYVGIVTAACLVRDGYDVVGVDVNEDKLEMIRNGVAPVIEPGLPDLIRMGVKQKKLVVTSDPRRAVLDSSISLVCVGTPSAKDGSLDEQYVEAVCRQIGAALIEKNSIHTLVIRSTLLPGTTGKYISELKRLLGEKIHIAYNPEFLREGSAIRDYDSPPFTIIGCSESYSENVVRELYRNIKAKVFVTDVQTSEMVKYICNIWHAAKITFANEIGRISDCVKIDSLDLMKIITSDTKLNISPSYMRPGFAFGGSCLPKDLRAMLHYSRLHNVNVPFMRAILKSNEEHIVNALERIVALGRKNVGLLGLAFKDNTDDLRESAAVELAERLIGKGFEVRIFDTPVQKAKLMGSNKLFIENKLPHLTRLLIGSGKEIVDHADVLVITQDTPEIRKIVQWADKSTILIDLIGTIEKDIQEKKRVEVPIV